MTVLARKKFFFSKGGQLHLLHPEGLLVLDYAALVQLEEACCRDGDGFTGELLAPVIIEDEAPWLATLALTDAGDRGVLLTPVFPANPVDPNI